MPFEPLVSVVLPTYNRRKLVTRAVQSVLEQSYRNLELIVVDDGSSDATGEALEYFTGDPRFHYLYQSNKGQSAARNRAIDRSCGEYIAFLDSDNYWLPEKLERQLEFLGRHDGFEILYSEIIPVEESGARMAKRSIPRFSGRILEQLLVSNCVTNNTALVKRSCFEEMGKFDEGLRYCEDYDLWLRFATRYRFLYHPCDVACYCYEGERLSSAEEKVIAANKLILSRFFESYPGQVGAGRRRRAWSSLHKWEIESRWSSGLKPTGLELVRLLGLNPLDAQSWRMVARRVLR